MATLRTVVRWLIAGFFGLGAFGILIDGSVLSALIMLAGAALIAPPIGRAIGQRVAPLKAGVVQVVVGFVVVMVGVIAGAAQQGTATKPATADTTTHPSKKAPPAPKFTCERGTSADGAVVNVLGKDGHDLRNAPDGERIVNEKATRVLGSTQYQTIDNSTKVQIQCLDGDWARVQITDPEWLKEHSGWVLRSALAAPLKPGEVREFTDADFDWDKHTQRDKTAIIKAVNRIHREDPRCKEHIYPSLVGRSADETKKRGKPVYFVNCGTGAQTVNVYFDAARADDPTPFRAPRFIDKMRAIDLCEAYAKANASHPSTVEFSRFLDIATSEHPNGRTQVQSSFTAKNSFGLELKFNISCLLDENGFIEGNISEAR
ncbi:MAG: hypothetical protein J0L89_08380 [Xanthomonadales bacterium]|nr:hypothetical protein [Xanthomonadales bacterium]MCA0198453.1 hypothetical protein [Pseudomonadota bacterium]HEL3179386.1 hypothetical protein [Stenotrophomonas maltophilia]HEL3182496.1 hypothetical protein [Stenotrophomonas maltophilia]